MNGGGDGNRVDDSVPEMMWMMCGWVGEVQCGKGVVAVQSG